jgi:hypothetical protein
MKFIKSYQIFENRLSQNLSLYEKHLRKSTKGVDLSNFDNIKEILIRDCKPFIDELISTDSGLIFRGVRYDGDEITPGLREYYYIENRKPVDINPIISDMFDDFFLKKFGFKLRGNGVFGSKFPQGIRGYQGHGITNTIFFPIKNFEYFWNPDIYDLFSDIEGEDWYEDYWSNMKLTKREIKDIVDGFRKGGLNEIGVNEITFRCVSYYLVDESYYFKIKDWIRSID